MPPQYDSRIRIPVAGTAKDLQLFERVIIHELSHAIVANIAPHAVPAWLDEGLAQHFEGRDADVARRRLLAGGRFIPLPELERSFGRLGADDARVAYDESLLARDPTGSAWLQLGSVAPPPAGRGDVQRGHSQFGLYLRGFRGRLAEVSRADGARHTEELRKAANAEPTCDVRRLVRTLPLASAGVAKHLRQPLQQLPADDAIRDDERPEVPIVDRVTNQVGGGSDRLDARPPIDQGEFAEIIERLQRRFLFAASRDDGLAGFDDEEGSTARALVDDSLAPGVMALLEQAGDHAELLRGQADE